MPGDACQPVATAREWKGAQAGTSGLNIAWRRWVPGEVRGRSANRPDRPPVDNSELKSQLSRTQLSGNGRTAIQSVTEPRTPLPKAWRKDAVEPRSCPVPDIAAALRTLLDTAPDRFDLLLQGGPVILMIAALSVLTVALVLWKVWRLALIGAWSGGRRAERAVRLWESGDIEGAERLLAGRRTCRAAVVLTAMRSLKDPALGPDAAEAETVRVAKGMMARLRSGLRPLELIATIAPLLGLLGTVLGMIAAFQALQEAGSRADPATLAGGIWEALLTTAAGMAVAIPASAALTWFEAVADRLRHEMEDLATRLRVRAPEVTSQPLRQAAE